MLEASPDSYLLSRDVYLQQRAYQAEQEKPVEEDPELKEFLDELDE